ncbi:hypothetical protein BJX65DRAFT_317942 [Aspergillus insuetus]
MPHVQLLSRPVDIVRDQAGDSIWRLPPDIESEITTLATVCHVEHQQRIPLAAGREEDIREADSSDDEESENGSHFATDSVRMEFLDQLAELICRDKDANYVTCTSLMESEEEVTIFAARNAAWVDADVKLLEEVASMLESVATTESASEDIMRLRGEFSIYYNSRLKHHAKALLGMLGKGEKATNSLPTLKRREMEYICRPRHAFGTFYKVACEVPGMKRVKIMLLPGYESRRAPPHHLSLGSKAQSEQDSQRLNAELRKRKWVHAEMRMALHLLSTDNVARMFPYLGINKKTCLLCGHVLKQSGVFQARGNHGKVYGQWTLPRAIAMPAAYHEKLAIMIKKLRDVLRHECNFEGERRLAPVKESTISTPVAEPQVLWSPFNRFIPDPRLHSREMEWLSQRYRERMAGRKNATDSEEPKGPPSHVTDDEALYQTETFETVPDNTRPSCAKCGVRNDTLISCQKCKSTDWTQHKPLCRLGRPLDEADGFIQACHEQIIPSDNDVAKAFGFLFFTSAVDRQRLFRLYCSLVNQWGVSEEELRAAWKSDKLKELIQFRGSQIPCARNRIEIRWLLQQNGFGVGVVTNCDTVFETHRHILNPKLESYVFWCQTLNGTMPDVDEDNWIYLGFCTTPDASQTQRLAQLYRLLIEKATFEHFWPARASSTMVELFQKCGLGNEIQKMRNFESLMSAMGTWYQSVWELKRLTVYHSHTPNAPSLSTMAYTQFFNEGADEMALHQACIENRLASFLRSELGSLSFDPALLECPYPLDGCNYMAMIVETGVLCPESASGDVSALQRARGGEEGVILTHPDDVDKAVGAALEDRAAFLKQGVTIRKTRVNGGTLQSMSGL